jgi:hypothetical protein
LWETGGEPHKLPGVIRANQGEKAGSVAKNQPAFMRYLAKAIGLNQVKWDAVASCISRHMPSKVAEFLRQ